MAENKPGTLAIRAESRVDPTPLIGVEGSDGTSDVILVTDDTLEVVDYKDGMVPVSAEDNEQMELYALGALAQYPTAEFKWVKMTIIQPKLRLKGIDPISSHTVSVEALKAKAFSYQIGAMATESDDAELIPGERQCKWCRARQNCKAYADYSSDAAGLDVVNMVDDAAKDDPNDLSDERIREIITAAPLIRSLIEGAEKEALRRFEAGHEIEGLKTVRGRGSYSWALSDDEIAERLGKMGIPKQARYVTKVLSPAQAKKVSWTKKVKGEEVTKKLSDRQIKTLESEYISKSEGSLKVVPESDECKAVTNNVASLFKPTESGSDETPDWMKGG